MYNHTASSKYSHSIITVICFQSYIISSIPIQFLNMSIWWDPKRYYHSSSELDSNNNERVLHTGVSPLDTV